MSQQVRFEANGRQFQKRLVDYFVVYTCKPRRRIDPEEDPPSTDNVELEKKDECEHRVDCVDHAKEEIHEIQIPLHSSTTPKVGNHSKRKLKRRTASRSIHLNVAPGAGLPTMVSIDDTLKENFLEHNAEIHSEKTSDCDVEYFKFAESFRGLRVPAVAEDQDVNERYDDTDENDSIYSQQTREENLDDIFDITRINEHEMTPTRIRPKYSDEDKSDINEEDLHDHVSPRSTTDNIVPPSDTSDKDDGVEMDGSVIVSEFTLVPVETARYPKEDLPDCPMNPMVSHFCFPLPMKISKEYKIPKVHYFVLTNDKGRKMYGICLTVWEEFVASDDGNPDEKEFSDLVSKKGVIHVEGMCESDIEVSLTSKSVSVYMPKVLCILSSHAYLQSFREYLAQLYRLATMTNIMKVPIERYIVNICEETPAPPPGSFEIRLKILNAEIAFWSPPANQPVAYVALPFNILFECLDINNIIFVWYALTLERKILLLSSHCSLLTVCAEILCSLLFPMEWNHLYIPILPRFLTPMLDAPIPYLCGIARQHLGHAIQSISDETIVVDLDQNLITLGESTPSFPPMSKTRRSKLEASLEQNAGDVFWAARGLSKSDICLDGKKSSRYAAIMKQADLVWKEKLEGADYAFNLGFTPDSETLLNEEIRKESLDENFNIKYKQSRWDNVQESFLRFYVSMLRDYKKFIDPDQCFNTEDYIKSQRSDYKHFLKEFCHTQQFDCFITKKIFHPQDPAILFFDQSINAKKNRSKMSLKKKETSFLTHAHAHTKLRTVNALQPAGKEMNGKNLLDMIYESKEKDSRSFTYQAWPEKFNEHLFGSARPIPIAIAAEFDRLDTSNSTSPKRNQNVDERWFHSNQCCPDVQTATFTLFFVLFCKGVVGKEFESMHAAFLKGKTHMSIKNRQKLIEVKLQRVIAEEVDEKISSQRFLPDCAQWCSNCIDPFKNVADKADTIATANLRPMYADELSVACEDFNGSQERMEDPICEADVEVAKILAVGQLDLAFSVLEMIHTNLPVDKESFRVLMEACGRCGDTDRATQLMWVMKDQRFVFDSEIYASYLAAFTTSNSVNPNKPKTIPLNNIPLSSTNRPHKYSASSGLLSQQLNSSDLSVIESTNQSQTDSFDVTDGSGDDSSSIVSSEFVSESSRSKLMLLHSSGGKSRMNKIPRKSAFVVTELIERHISIGDTLLDYLYDGIRIDCQGDTCPQCSVFILKENIMMGWTLGSFEEYTTTCVHCKHRFIPRFVVNTASTSFIGSQGPGTPLYCEFLSPWIVQKEIFLATDGFENLNIILKPEWRSENDFRAKLWWNLIVLFKEYKIPFSFLLQGSFRNHLIMPMDIPKT